MDREKLRQKVRQGKGGMVSEQRKKTEGQGFSHSGVWSNALKALCFNRIVKQDTSSLTGSCCLEHND